MPDQTPLRWEPDRVPSDLGYALPSWPQAFGRGLLCRCPSCGMAPIFRGYLKVVHACASCGAPLGLARADDAPPYFTIVIVAHVIVTGMLVVERTYTPPLWVHAAIWLPLTLVMTLALLRPVKGATVGLMLKLGMLKNEFDEGT